MWARNSYVSCNLSTGGSDGETDSGEEEEEDDTVACDIQYIVGDVTHPQHSGNGDTIAVHCVGTSSSLFLIYYYDNCLIQSCISQS